MIQELKKRFAVLWQDFKPHFEFRPDSFEPETGTLVLRRKGRSYPVTEPCRVQHLSGCWRQLDADGRTPIPYVDDTFPKGLTIVAGKGGCSVRITYFSYVPGDKR